MQNVVYFPSSNNSVLMKIALPYKIITIDAVIEKIESFFFLCF